MSKTNFQDINFKLKENEFNRRAADDKDFKKRAAIVLTGGKSSRMGTNKALLSIGQEPMLKSIVDRLKPLFSEVIVATNDPELYENLEVYTVKDIIPGKGPLSGIHAGLINSPYWYNFVVACDMPFLVPEFIEFLFKQAGGYDVVVPYRGIHLGRKYLEPLHAVYSKGCINAIEECLKKGEYQAYAFYSQVKVKYLDVNKLSGSINLNKSLFNVNTPKDLEKARRLVQDESENTSDIRRR
ncbi:MAG: molybdenum cofactor guanylyltransferase [Clostridia bacterium]|nr:molybdenum cofactor guanylyltransferase [Clostridia bacterium]